MSRKLPNLTLPNLTPPTGTRKLAEWDLYSRPDFRWSRYQRARVNGVKGTFYFSTSALSDSVRELPASHSNVVILASRSEYAPEQVRSVVFVADKGMRR